MSKHFTFTNLYSKENILDDCSHLFTIFVSVFVLATQWRGQLLNALKMQVHNGNTLAKRYHLLALGHIRVHLRFTPSR